MTKQPQEQQMLQKLDKYILSEFWLPLVSGAGIITGVWLGIDKFKEVFKLLARSGAGMDKGLVILGLEIPQILAITLPIAVLLASFLTFQKLSGQSEIIAMRAAGISYKRLMIPVALLGLFGCLASFMLSEFVVPITNPFAKEMYTVALYKEPLPKKSTKSFSYFEKDGSGVIKRIFYVRHFRDDVLRGIVILDFAERQLAQIYTAKRGKWDVERGGWKLEKGNSHYIKAETKDDQNSMDLVSKFESTFIPSSVNPNKILKESASFKDMNFAELSKYIDLHGEDIYTNELSSAKTKFHTKFSYPISCVLLALIGASLGIVGRRRVINWGYILIGLVVFVFYMSQSVFDSLGDSGKIEPFISVWIPNLILGALAFYAVSYRANKS